MPIPQKKNTITQTTAKERIFRTLREWIIEGTLLPDERLNDAELAQYFSVSRTPVREAIQLLSEQKLVYIIPSSGTFVTPIDEEDMRHVYTLLAGLHALALELCIDRITPEDLAYMGMLNERFYKYARMKNANEANKADFDLHRYLCQLTGNPHLVEFSDQLALQARRNENRFLTTPEAHPELSYEAHKRILAALEAGDLPTAQDEIRRNWIDTLKSRTDPGERES